ncbi:MAG: cupin domain-containing protein [Reyranella sp.]|jgi:quercetin dioxygenase-like cupin family protein|nr:cupin domain-containing protein [Reyranella sp.]MBL6650514.1 cupin domain-containing protein [Reyranella sp.]
MTINRRLIVGCALCAVSGLVATRVSAQTPPAATPGVKRKILQQVDGPAAGYTTLIVEVEIEPGATVARHTHPGIESVYFIEGGGELSVEGQPAKQLNPGDAFQIPPGVPHGLKNGAKATRGVATYVIEKGKPLASPA